MGKESMVYPYSGILLGRKKEGILPSGTSWMGLQGQGGLLALTQSWEA